MQCRIVSGAAQNFHTCRNFIGGQERQNLIKKNLVDSGVDNLLFTADGARSLDVGAERFGSQRGGNGVHIGAIGSRGDVLNRNFFSVKSNVNSAALKRNFRAESRFALAFNLDVVNVPFVAVALSEIERRAVNVNLVNGGNRVVAQGKQFKINLCLVDAGDEFVALVENFNVANNQIAFLARVQNIQIVQVDAADFDGHAQIFRGNFFGVSQCLLDNRRPL